MRFPLAWNFAYFRQPPPPPPFFFNQNDSTVEYFCIDLKGFFYALIKFAFTHLTIPFFFVSQTLNTALGKKKKKKRNLLCFCLELCETFFWKSVWGSLTLESLWDSPLLDKFKWMTPAWLWGASDGGHCNWCETERHCFPSYTLFPGLHGTGPCKAHSGIPTSTSSSIGFPPSY